MNRRNFFRGLLALGAGFTILPPATTYARIWRAQRLPLISAIESPWASIEVLEREFFHDFKFCSLNTGESLYDFLLRRKGFVPMDPTA